jgi:hypothetical protein
MEDASQQNWGAGYGFIFGEDTPATIFVNSAISDGANGTPRIESETRPINMSVQWVMKVNQPVERVAVGAPAGTSGSVLGGSGVIGGMDYSFSGATPGNFTARYESIPFLEAMSLLSNPGGFNFVVGTEPIQFWELDYDPAFTSVTLTLGYDDSSFIFPYTELSLEAVHYVEPFRDCSPGVDCSWIQLPSTVDDVANTITFTTTGFSQFVLASGPALGPSAWKFKGIAEGGTIDFAIGVVALQVTTTSGQTAQQVAQAVADAINANATLAAAGITATVNGRVVSTNGSGTSNTINDPGLTLVDPFTIPALSLGGVLLLVVALLLVFALRRTKTDFSLEA